MGSLVRIPTYKNRCMVGRMAECGKHIHVAEVKQTLEWEWLDADTLVEEWYEA